MRTLLILALFATACASAVPRQPLTVQTIVNNQTRWDLHVYEVHKISIGEQVPSSELGPDNLAVHFLGDVATHTTCTFMIPLRHKTFVISADVANPGTASFLPAFGRAFVEGRDYGYGTGNRVEAKFGLR